MDDIAIQSNNQYSLAKILGIWFVAALPMAILAYVSWYWIFRRLLVSTLPW